jgi:redox-sensitive bicupin YhaK (pirin superfamily)
MMAKRYRDERGHADAGWLKSMHSFSFGHYQDPDHMGFGPLRVINEDRVIPGAGFAEHGHRNMEIISYVLKGKLAHKDSMGNGSKIVPGDVQLMSAGSGIRHSEFNGSEEEEVHFLQIWIEPNVKDEAPDYQEKSFEEKEMQNKFRVLVSSDGQDGSLKIKQDARMFAGKFDENYCADFQTENGRKYWLQMAQGIAEVNGEKASAGDGFAIEGAENISVKTITESEILIFDLPY